MSKIIFEKLNGAPQAEGVYLYVNGFHPLDKEFVHVYWRPTAYHGGVEFQGYWAAHNGRDVTRYRGQWYREVNAAVKPVEAQEAIAVNDDYGDCAYRDWTHLP